MAERQSTLRRARWIAIALLLVAFAALAYREGFRRGYEPDGLAAAQTSSSLMIVTYPVADLIASTPSQVLQKPASDFDPLIDLIVSTVEHDSWMENGAGEGEIQPFPSNGSLMISQTRRVHKQISDLLEQLRRLGGEIDAKQAITLFQSWAALGRGRFHEFRTFPATTEGKQARIDTSQSLCRTSPRFGELRHFTASWGTKAFRAGRQRGRSLGGRAAQASPTCPSVSTPNQGRASLSVGAQTTIQTQPPVTTNRRSNLRPELPQWECC